MVAKMNSVIFRPEDYGILAIAHSWTTQTMRLCIGIPFRTHHLSW